MKKDESNINKEENRISDSTLNDLNGNYSKYIVEDIDCLFESSNEDIDTKMNNIINKRKKEDNNTNNIIIHKNKIDTKSKSKEKNKIEQENKLEINNIRTINNSSLNKNNSFDEKKNKILVKKRKLELIKKKGEKYIDNLNFQSKKTKKEIEDIENQITKQKNKKLKVIEKLNLAQKYSKSANNLNYRGLQIKDGFEIIFNLFERHLNNLKLFFFESFLNKSENIEISNYEQKLNKRKASSINKKKEQNDLINIHGNRKSFFLTRTDMEKIQKEMELKKIKYHYSYIRNKSFDKFSSEESKSIKEK